jgi:PIN domain nuclease of toxin-antitoxin system
MRVLLDTHAFLWLIGNLPKLSKKAKKIFTDKDNEILLSVASIWEMGIKLSLGKLELTQPFNKFIPTQLHQNGISQLDINFRHINEVVNLPFHHRDPFDRLIISQAITEGTPIISNDNCFDLYEVERIW